MKKSRIIISIIILLLLISYIFINEYRAKILSRKLSLYEESIKSLNDITNTSRESFNDLYSTLSRVIAEESKKNKDLLRATRHVIGYLTALLDYGIITQEEYQTLSMDLQLSLGS